MLTYTGKFIVWVVIKIMNDFFLLQEQFCQYWPSDVGEMVAFTSITVKLLSEEDKVDFSIRELDLSFKHRGPAEDSEVNKV